RAPRRALQALARIRDEIPDHAAADRESVVRVDDGGDVAVAQARRANPLRYQRITALAQHVAAARHVAEVDAARALPEDQRILVDDRHVAVAHARQAAHGRTGDLAGKQSLQLHLPLGGAHGRRWRSSRAADESGADQKERDATHFGLLTNSHFARPNW